MTLAHVTPAVAVEDVDAAVAVLRARGLRVSSARRVVLEALFVAEGPVSAEEIADGVPGRVPPSDLASVYRNLETLEEVGLVRHVHLGHGPGRYALPLADDREYLVCEHCDAACAVPEAELADVRSLIQERFGFRPSFSHFPIVGLCAACALQPGGEEESHAHV
jgi:Fur family transcriptional regulator, ferric uptake regulator